MQTNALVHEKSPYLRQHANNPVDWMPWGDEAFAKAKREDKPIFLSIGYSTCHWCHVMAHESFENEAVAAILNRDFVPVKLDREERPDVDRIYMLFVQASTGSGGWPMSVWLTPDRKPFFGGTYFPPDGRYGRPGFADLLQHLAHAWRTDRARIEESSQSVLGQLRGMISHRSGGNGITEAAFGSAWPTLRRSFDSTYGGFGAAPKFPRPVNLNYLFRLAYREKNEEAASMATETLLAMARGGMCDQLGGGFHRYSVDERWFVPHFEKMLYDQAQLAVSYLEAFQITKGPTFAVVAEDIFRYVLRDMTDGQGGFYSAEDADSPDPDNPSHSGEGAFYVWRQAAIEDLLPTAEAAAVKCFFGVEPDGNVSQDPHGEFTGRNILHAAMSAQDCALRVGLNGEAFGTALQAGIETLFEHRKSRPRPHLDNKVLTAWNALMISALVKGFECLEREDYLVAAERAMSFCLSAMRTADGTGMFRRFCDGEAAVPAFLDDYAFLCQACVDLFEGTGKAEYLKQAVHLGELVLSFGDSEDGGFFSTTAEAPDLVFRMKDDYDGAEPSGNSVATDVLLRLAHLTNRDDFQTAAEKALQAAVPKLLGQPTASPQMLVALGRYQSAAQQTVVRCLVVNDEVQALLRAERQEFVPYTAVFALSDAEADRLRGTAPFLQSLERRGSATIYRCRNFACELPEVVT